METEKLKAAFTQYIRAMAERSLFLSAGGSKTRVDVQIGGLERFISDVVGGINWDVVDGNPLSSTEGQIRELRNKFELTDKQLSKAQCDVSALKQQNANQYDLLVDRGFKIQNLERTANDLHRQVDEICAIRLRQDNEIADLKKKLQHQTETAEWRIKELSKALEETKAKYVGIVPVAEFVSRIKQADARIKQLEGYLEKAASDYTAAVGHKQHELNELEKRLEECQNRNSQLEARFRRDLNEHAALQRQLEETQKGVTAWQQAEHNLAAQLNLVRKESNDKDRQINGLTGAVATYIRQEGEQRKCIQELDEKCVKLQRELQALKAETSVTIGRLTLYKTEYEARKRYLSDTSTLSYIMREKAQQAVEALYELK